VRKLRGEDPQELDSWRRGLRSDDQVRDEQLYSVFANGCCALMEVPAGADVNGGGGSETGKFLVLDIDEWVAAIDLSDDFAEKTPVSGNDGFVLALALGEFSVEKVQRMTSLWNFRVDLISLTLNGGEGHAWPRDLAVSFVTCASDAPVSGAGCDGDEGSEVFLEKS
jgi:hypothetical protein